MPSLTADAQQKLDCDPESWGCCWSEQASAGSASGSTSVYSADAGCPSLIVSTVLRIWRDLRLLA